MKKIEKSLEFGGRKLTLTTGHVAGQADAAVMASYGETVVLATVVSSPLKIDLGYFPLTVEYQERLYAGGKIKGSRWIKREGRPTDEEVLTARLVDRSIRPLFPKHYKKEEVQVILTVMSVDLENTPETIAAVAASAALAISPIPWDGPVGLVEVGLIDGKFVTNPKDSERKASDMELCVAATDKAVVMIEAGCKQVPEEKIVKGVAHALEETQKLIKFINELADAVGTKKKPAEKPIQDKGLEKKVEELVKKDLPNLIKQSASKEVGYGAYDELKKAVMDAFDDKDKALAAEYLETLFAKETRKMIIFGKRPDGRKNDELRALSAEVSILPRTHGSAIFNRGQTQVLSITTLGAPSLGQLLETAEGEETKRYIHHYSMPPYSTGETGRVGYPSRREVGHGALAERALLPVIPDESEFPYTIRVVSEVLSSNGSTSMASVCGSTLSLMDAGVPIKAPVAGIAMGLIVESAKKFYVLTDIVGLEDGNGDMDFKVAGTKDGVTALQLDVKTLDLTLPILEAAMSQALKTRLAILEVINSAIKEPRNSVSAYAPKIKQVKIPTDKIGELIGPGGKNIRGIMAATGTQVDVDEDGTVFISGMDADGVAKAVAHVEGIAKDPMPGEIYEGTVKRVQPFGLFVEVLPQKEGLVHVSDMSEDFVSDPGALHKVGDTVSVRVKEIDDLGRLNLSMLLDPEADKKKEGMRQERRGGGRRFDDNGGRRGGRSFSKDGGRSSGPHFPKSRYLQQDNSQRGRNSR